MALRVQIVNPYTVRVQANDVNPQVLARWVRSLAERLQLAISRNFQNMRTWGGNLRANTARYDLSKIRRGRSPLRGHATGRMQRAIERVRAWRIVPVGGGFDIRWSDKPLYAAVPYAEYYAGRKVVGGRIFGIPPTWLGDIKKFLKDVPTLPSAQARRGRGSALVQVGAAIRAATRREERTTRVEVGR